MPDQVLRRNIRFLVGWDKRSTEPNKNYGVHGAALAFELVGPWGAVVFDLQTYWMPKTVTEFWEPVGDTLWPRRSGWPDRPTGSYPMAPSAGSINIHSKADLGSQSEYSSGWPFNPNCIYVPGGCYSTGHFGEYDLLVGLFSEGEDWLFSQLEQTYRYYFGAIGSHYSI